ncbi:hypothetical protein V6Z12_D02G072300 [Gossypium hirsutum]
MGTDLKQRKYFAFPFEAETASFRVSLTPLAAVEPTPRFRWRGHQLDVSGERYRSRGRGARARRVGLRHSRRRARVKLLRRQLGFLIFDLAENLLSFGLVGLLIFWACVFLFGKCILGQLIGPAVVIIAGHLFFYLHLVLLLVRPGINWALQLQFCYF